MGLNERLLDQFCEWMGSYEEASDWHHDIAVLLTRQVICDGGSNCNALGELGIMGLPTNLKLALNFVLNCDICSSRI